MTSVPDLRTRILLRSEQSGGYVSMMENVVAARSAGPPLPRTRAICLCARRADSSASSRG